MIEFCNTLKSDRKIDECYVARSGAAFISAKPFEYAEFSFEKLEYSGHDRSFIATWVHGRMGTANGGEWGPSGEYFI